MSVKVMGIVWDAELPRDQKFILLAYADHADHDGRSIFPALNLIAWKTGYSKRQIQRITEELVEAQILISEGASNLGTNQYRIDFSKLTIREYQRPKSGRPKGDVKMSPPLEKPHDILTKPHDIAVSTDSSLESSYIAPDGAGAKNGGEKEVDPILLKYPILKRMPHENGALLVAFSEVSGIKPLEKDFKLIMKATWDLRHREITPEIVTEAVQRMRRDGLIISSLLSITKVCISLKSQGNGNGGNGHYNYDEANTEMERRKQESIDYWKNIEEKQHV